ncbi:hypothetical protein SprV_0200767300 [Sparganum proliferum]
MRPKDPIPKQEMSAVVYRLQCSRGKCNYVGETDRRQQARMREHPLAVQRLNSKSEVATHVAQMGHIFNFDAVELVGRGDDHKTRQVKEAWMSADCSVNHRINLPTPYLVLRTFLTGNSHGEGQPGSSTVSAADEGGAIQVTVTCESDAATQAALAGHASNKVRHIRRAVCMTSQSLEMGGQCNYSKRRTSNKPLPVNASSSFDMPPGNRIFTTIEIYAIF